MGPGIRVDASKTKEREAVGATAETAEQSEAAEEPATA